MSRRRSLLKDKNDLNAFRYKELKDYLLMKEGGHDVVSLSKLASEYKLAINNQDLYSASVITTLNLYFFLLVIFFLPFF